jgi:hypothetical protein
MVSFGKKLAVLFSFCALLLVFTDRATAQYGRAPGGVGPGGQRSSDANVTYYIVEVGRELQIVPKSGMTELKKRVDEEYKAAMKAYEAAKKDKTTKGVTLEKPEKKTVKQIKSGIKGQEKAQEELQKLLTEREKGNKSKR